MRSETIEPINLATVADGAAVQLFERELARVLENILNPDTAPEAQRSITLKIVFLPDKNDRGQVSAVVDASSKLAPERGAAAILFVGRRNGRATAVSADPRQGALFQDDPPGPLGVVQGEKEV